MKTKNFFSISPALIKENFKMYWYLPVLSFIAYFMSGVFPLIMNPQYLTDPHHWYINDCLQNWNVAFMFMLIAAPLVGSIVMMNYLHNPVMTMAIHAQPFSKGKIFWSHTLTGWLMCILPPTAMTLIYLIITQRPSDSIEFWLTSVAIITFFCGIFTLAGVLGGTSVMHILLCGLFFGIIPLVIWITQCYCQEYLAGFSSMPDWMERVLFDTNPILNQISYSGIDFTPLRIAAYFLIGAAFLVISALLYKRAKLERVGDSIIFSIAEEIITWLVVFVGMAAVGFFFTSVLYGKMMMLSGMVVGALLAFIIVKIVIGRSIHILTRQNICSLASFLVLALIFSGFTMFDMSGFSKRVPSAANVISVYRNDFGFSEQTYYWYDNIDEALTSGQESLTSPEAVSKMIALHQYVVDNRLYDLQPTNSSMRSWSAFNYELENGSTMRRNFHFWVDDECYRMMKDISTDDEYVSDTSLLDIFTVENINYMEFNFNVYESASNVEESATLLVQKKDDIEKILKALADDHIYQLLSDDSLTVAKYEENADTATLSLDKMYVSGRIVLNSGLDGVSTESDGAANIEFQGSNPETFKALATLIRDAGHDGIADLLTK